MNKKGLLQQSVVVTPLLDELELTASVDNRVERLSPQEYELFSQLLRYPEQSMKRYSLKDVCCDDASSLSDRRLDTMMRALISKANVLCPEFPVLRFVEPDSYVYTEQPPRKPKED
ncbi:hypothetical protein AB833_17480 [Chromatiales bacterium (ex Bugula neritina AB1)]|nr:hypothetical protein AB833_17480 [Chromatiales bacterium (ex Bugula neritina AB1)]